MVADREQLFALDSSFEEKCPDKVLTLRIVVIRPSWLILLLSCTRNESAIFGGGAGGGFRGAGHTRRTQD